MINGKICAIFRGTLCAIMISSKLVLDRLAIFAKITRIIVRIIKSKKKMINNTARTSNTMLDQSAAEVLMPAEDKSC